MEAVTKYKKNKDTPYYHPNPFGSNQVIIKIEYAILIRTYRKVAL